MQDAQFRFEVALSFPGEHRPRVERIARILADRLGKKKILYDRWYAAEFARPNLDVYLPKLYHEQSRLLVFFLCGEYEQKDWCGLEWRVARDLLKQRRDEQLMFLRIDGATIRGLYVESRTGAVAVVSRWADGSAFASPPQSGLAWLCFLFPLIEPDWRFSRIRLSEKTHAFAHGRLAVRLGRLTRPNTSLSAASGNRLYPGRCTLCLSHSHRRSRVRTC